MTYWPTWLIILALAGTLIASTLAYTLRIMSRVTLEKELAKRSRQGRLEELVTHQDDLALAFSIVRIACNIGVVALCIYALRTHPRTAGPLETPAIFIGSVLLAGALLLVFSVALAHAWARYAGEALVAALAPALRPIYRLLYPLVLFLKLFDGLVGRLAGVTPQAHAREEAVETREEILAAVSEGSAQGAVDEEQKKMIEGIISFRDLQVGQIMMPRTDMITVSVHAPLEEIREKILRDGLSRLPVHDGNLDNILGILYAKDLLGLLGAADPPPTLNIRTLMRPPLFVPHSKPLRDLLRQFRMQRVHMAIVLDEFGGTAGLVTSEDILEEIVGEITDEYEKAPPSQIYRLNETIVEVDGRTNITDLNRELDLDLPESQDYQTIGGLVVSHLGTIPNKGESLTMGALRITVTESDPRRIRRLQILLPESQELSGPGVSPQSKS